MTSGKPEKKKGVPVAWIRERFRSGKERKTPRSPCMGMGAQRSNGIGRRREEREGISHHGHRGHQNKKESFRSVRQDKKTGRSKKEKQEGKKSTLIPELR